jgi:hypothetical protein
MTYRDQRPSGCDTVLFVVFVVFLVVAGILSAIVVFGGH